MESSITTKFWVALSRVLMLTLLQAQHAQTSRRPYPRSAAQNQAKELSVALFRMITSKRYWTSLAKQAVLASLKKKIST
jgi:hypothetical protein